MRPTSGDDERETRIDVVVAREMFRLGAGHKGLRVADGGQSMPESAATQPLVGSVGTR